MFVQFNIWVKDGQNEGPQTCLNLVCEDLYHSFQKNSVCVELFPQFELPSASRQPFPDVFVTSLSLLCLCYSCLSSDCSQETFLEKPQGTDFLCTSGQQTESVFSWLQLCSSPWGLREGQHLRKMRRVVEQKLKPTRRKKTETMAGPEPHIKVVLEGQECQIPHLTHIFSLGRYNFLPFFPSGHLQKKTSASPLWPLKMQALRKAQFCLGVRWEPYGQCKETDPIERTPRPQ